MKTPTRTRLLRTGLAAAAIAGVLGTATLAPAFADERGHGDWHEHHDRDRDWHDHDRDGWRGYAYTAPGYYYPPGYGYSYAPAPAYVAPSLNLGFTIR